MPKNNDITRANGARWVSESPFADGWELYYGTGLGGVFQLPPRVKNPPPKNVTGWTGRDADAAQLRELTRQQPDANIGLHLAPGVIAIDVDHYDTAGGKTKPGGDTLAEAERLWGPLDPLDNELEMVVNTNREDGKSGHYFFRVPDGVVLKGTIGFPGLGGIEILQYHHRYSVLPPSVHPSGRPYRWMLDGKDAEPGWAPKLDDIPWLPDTWVENLKAESVREATGRSSAEEMAEFFEDFVEPDGHMCKAMRRKYEKFKEDLAGSAGEARHDMALRASGAALRLGEMGHHGATTCLDQMEMDFAEAVGPDRGSFVAAELEFRRMITNSGFVAEILASATRPLRRGCHCVDKDADPAGPSQPDDAEEEFWTSRESLAHIRAVAHARMDSAWSTLGTVLARVVSSVSPRIRLPHADPSDSRSTSSLNLFVANVGDSGKGKGASWASAKRAVEVRDCPEHSNPGSGQGLRDLFVRWDDEKKEPVQYNELALLYASEAKTTLGQGTQKNSILFPELCAAWSGEQLGQKNATRDRDIQVPEHEYRLCLVLGVQPGKAGPLLDAEDQGLPQRFIWMPTQDPTITGQTTTAPDPLVYRPKKTRKIDYRAQGAPEPELADPRFTAPNFDQDDIYVMQVPKTVFVEWRKKRLADHHGQSGEDNPLDSHALLVRLKVAAALALLDQRLDVSDEDWDLASIVMRVSNRQRDRVLQELGRRARDLNRNKGEMEAERASMVRDRLDQDEVKKEQAAVERVRKVLVRKVQRGDKPVTKGELRRSVRSTDRGHFDEALDRCVGSGELAEAGNQTYACAEEKS